MRFVSLWLVEEKRKKGILSTRRSGLSLLKLLIYLVHVSSGMRFAMRGGMDLKIVRYSELFKCF